MDEKSDERKALDYIASLVNKMVDDVVSGAQNDELLLPRAMLVLGQIRETAVIALTRRADNA